VATPAHVGMRRRVAPPGIVSPGDFHKHFSGKSDTNYTTIREIRVETGLVMIECELRVMDI
jgi:hypothetical protein